MNFEIEEKFKEMYLFYSRVENLYIEINKYFSLLFDKKYWAEKYTIEIDENKNIKVVKIVDNGNGPKSANDNLFDITKLAINVIDIVEDIRKFYRKNLENGKLEKEIFNNMQFLNKDAFYCYSFGLICIFLRIFEFIKDGKYDCKTNFTLFVKNFELYRNVVENIEKIFCLIKLGVEKYE
ncbi:MAG: hypothetical protein QW038_02780 [Nanopusillaceae archaeon]